MEYMHSNYDFSKSCWICVDLKSFYSSVECRFRNLDPLTTNLVVADITRTNKTICLAVSPSLKAYGIGGRARLFEVEQKVAEIKRTTGKTVEYIIAPPQMKKYIEVSSQIYNVYLRSISKDDIWVYSIDEVFIDATAYLNLYHLTPRELATKLVHDVFEETGITATAGIGSNPYLAKIAMDIVAKHVDADEYGVRVAELDEISYRRYLWNHRPLTSFWRVGPGIARKLESIGIYTMGQLAKFSLLKCYYDPNSYKADYLYRGDGISGEDRLFQLFGVDAELLIDHAWGREPCTMPEIKTYKSSTTSLSSGQVLSCPYTKEKALTVMREMVESLVLDIVQKCYVTNQVIVYLGFDQQLRTTSGPGATQATYEGELKKNHYGKIVPKPANGSHRFNHYTSSTKELLEAATQVYNEIYKNPDLMVRRINVVFANLIDEKLAQDASTFTQLDLFADTTAQEKRQKALEKEKKIQQAMLSIKSKYGKNAILTGTNYEDGATGRERNEQVGGHRG